MYRLIAFCLIVMLLDGCTVFGAGAGSLGMPISCLVASERDQDLTTRVAGALIGVPIGMIAGAACGFENDVSFLTSINGGIVAYQCDFEKALTCPF